MRLIHILTLSLGVFRLTSSSKVNDHFTTDLQNVLNIQSNKDILSSNPNAINSFLSVQASIKNNLNDLEIFISGLVNPAYSTCEQAIQNSLGLGMSLGSENGNGSSNGSSSNFLKNLQDMMFFYTFNYIDIEFLNRFHRAIQKCLFEVSTDQMSIQIYEDLGASIDDLERYFVVQNQNDKENDQNPNFPNSKITKKYEKLNLDFSTFVIHKNSLSQPIVFWADNTLYTGLKLYFYALAVEYTLGEAWLGGNGIGRSTEADLSMSRPQMSRSDTLIIQDINSILDKDFDTYSPEYVNFECYQRKKYWLSEINNLKEIDLQFGKIYGDAVGLSKEQVQDMINKEYLLRSISDDYIGHLTALDKSGSGRSGGSSSILVLLLILIFSKIN